jgi:diguanylate cyclase (GGDEF)-like protein
MRVSRRALTAAAAVVVLSVLAGGLAIRLVDAQKQSQGKLVAEWDTRAKVAAELTNGLLIKPNYSSVARTYFDVPQDKLPSGIRKYLAVAGDVPRLVVLDSGARVLIAYPAALSAAQARALSSSRHVRRTLTDLITLSDRYQLGPTRVPVIDLSIPFPTASGRHVVVVTQPVADLEAAAQAYLSSVASLAGSDSAIVDAGGNVVVASAGSHAGPDRRAELAALAGQQHARLGGNTLFAVDVGTTTWRVVLSVPTDKLLAPVRGASYRATWLLFGSFVAVIVALLLVGFGVVRSSAKLAAQRSHDPLTGLPNRAATLDRLEQVMANTRRSGLGTAVLFIDLDRFKPINDTYGHRVGDAVLATIAGRIRNALRPADVVGRLGGDEFLVICDNVPADADDPVLQLANRVADSVQTPVTVDGVTVSVGCSIGVATTASEQVSAAVIVHAADDAMYDAKHGGTAVTLVRVDPPAGDEATTPGRGANPARRRGEQPRDLDADAVPVEPVVVDAVPVD